MADWQCSVLKCLAFLCSSALVAEPGFAAGPRREAGILILDESAYWRHCIQFGPDQLDGAGLRAEGQSLLGEPGMERLRRKVLRYLRPPFAPEGEEPDPGKTDWRDLARIWFPVGQGDSERAALNCRSPAPVPEWPSPSFDDSPWPRQRLPLLVGNVLRPSIMHGDKEMQQLGVRAACLRTTFEVPDPQAGDFALSLSFRGGARVWLNGTEVARSHLPAAELRPQDHAEAYPKDAYLCLQDEVPPKEWDRELAKAGVVFCEDLPGRFDDAFADATPKEKREYWTSRGASRFAGYFGGWTQINRKGFERITRLRNRAIGPLTLPKPLLRKGANLLAIEIRASHIHPVVLTGREANWGRAFQREMFWSHCRLLGLELRSTAATAPSALVRPPGVQVWVEDVHRVCYGDDFGPAGPVGAIRFVGAVNGTYSAQIVVGADRELTGLKALPSALRASQGGAELPASAMRVGYLVGHPATQLVQLGQIRNMVEDRADPLCPPAEMAVVRYGMGEARAGRLPRGQRLEAAEKLRFFDHVGGDAPARMAAGACQPIWLSLTIPPDAAAGTYRGSVEIGAEGIEPVRVPVEAEAVGWRMPDPPDFQTVVALEQSPYGVAKDYGVPLWSEEHFRRLEGSFRQLARVGNRLFFIPCIQNTEFGNFDDTMVRWLRRKDGSVAFDYRILDRYLGLAGQHLRRPPLLCFVVMHGVDRFGPGDKLATSVPITEEATGKTGLLDLSNDAPGYRENWKAFAASLATHLRAKGMARSALWGFCWDNPGDPMLLPLLAEAVPEVGWARSSHTGEPNATFPLAITSLGRELTETSQKGWSNPFLELLCPRSGSSVLSSNGHSPPFTFRLAAHRSIVAGYRGLGRIGADYWADIFFRGYKGSLSGGIAGMPCSSVLWPGRDGAEPGARFEALREGIQETEARVYLEQCLARGLLPQDAAEIARRALDEHARQTLYVSPGRVGVQVHEYAAGWQERSRGLYRAAAEAAKSIGLDVDPTRIAGKIPARSVFPLGVKVRNWTPRPRAWRASADQPWIALGKQAGTVAGHELLDAAVDARRLPPNSTAVGKLTLTDVEANRSFAVEITAHVGKAFDLVMPALDFLGQPGHAACWEPKPVEDYAVLNVPAGGSDGGEYALVNFSGAELSWKITASADWLSAEPAAGRLAPGERVFVKVTAQPRDTKAAALQASLAVSDGEIEVRRRIVAHVIPAYRAPAAHPQGEAVPLVDLPKSRVKLHKTRAYWLGTSDPERADYGPRFGPNSQVEAGGAKADRTTMHAAPEQVTLYSIEGAGFRAFSARVRILPAYARPSYGLLHQVRVSFEVYADGQLCAQSGLMAPADDARLLVADGLDGARELKLVARYDRPEPRNAGRMVYVEWQEAKCYK